MNYKWNFSDNGTGQAEGFKNAGIWTFKEKAIASLARETIQNSIDAATNKKTIIEFDLFKINKNKLPGRNSLQEVFKTCKEIINDDRKTLSFFENGINILNQEEINILRISDYNTSGLLETKNKDSGNWFSLVKSTGNSYKGNNTSGGSYGIGKNAPFVTSDLRTVFYRTVNTNNEIAFQGVSVLMSHSHPDDKDKKTRGTGFLGEYKKNDPLYGREVLDFFTNNRDEETYGTDIFVAGYKYDNNWENIIIESIISNFFPRIHKEQLDIKVGKHLINNSTLPIYLKKISEEYTERNEYYHTYAYYKAMTSNNAEFFKENIEGVGEVELRILEGEEYPKKIAMTRNTGMIIYPRIIYKPLNCVGYFTTNDKNLSEFLRATEPPAHDTWSPEIYEEDIPLARRKIRKIQEWIQDKIQSIIEKNFCDLEDMPGLSEYLPDEIQTDKANRKKESIRTINILPKPYIPKMEFYTDLKEESNPKENDPKDETSDNTYSIDNTDINESNDKLKSKKKKKSRKRKSKKSGIQVLEKRWICINEGINEYLLVLNIDKTTDVRLKLLSIGEDGNVYPYLINEIRNFETNNNIDIKDDLIGPISLEKNTKSKFKIQSQENEKISVEVRLYENK